MNEISSSPNTYMYKPENFPLVRDFDAVSPSDDSYASYQIEEVLDFGEQRKCLLRKVKNIFNQNDLQGLIEEFKTATPQMQFKDPLTRKIFIHSTGLELVRFYEGKITHRSMDKCLFYQNSSPLIQRAIRVALERFGEELGCKNEKIKASCAGISYHLTSEESNLAPLKWHSDDSGSYGPVDYTMVVLLSDPTDEGWTGGKFLYTGRREIDWYNVYLKKIINNSNSILNHPKFPIWQATPSTNDAILFGNYGMNHNLTPIKPTNDRTTRIIFSLFVKMPKPKAKREQETSHRSESDKKKWFTSLKFKLKTYLPDERDQDELKEILESYEDIDPTVDKFSYLLEHATAFPIETRSLAEHAICAFCNEEMENKQAASDYYLELSKMYHNDGKEYLSLICLNKAKYLIA